jgi:effector-binding domain-containing protein
VLDTISASARSSEEISMMWLLRPTAMALAAAAFTMVASLPSRSQPARSESPAPAAPAAPTTPPAGATGAPAAQAPPGNAPAPAGQGADAFGEEVTLTAKPIIYLKGTATWDTAFDTLVDAFKSVQSFVDREKLKPAGPFMTIYTATDDTGFQFEAALPLEEEPKNAPKGDLTVGKSPDGRALKFVHRGSYDAMDATYDAITNYLDEKKLDAKDLFIEQYVSDPLTTPQDKLVIDIFVPVQ